jgi:hypothetical protein
MNFLAAKLPPIPRTQLQMLQPGLVGHTLAPSQVVKLAKYMKAVEDPVAIVEDMRTGQLTPEAAEALKAVYPDLWADMRQVAITEVASAKEPISHTAVVRLSLLFDFVGTPSLSREFQMTHESVIARTLEQSQQQIPPPSRQEIPDMASSAQTLSQRLVMSM